MKTWALVQQNLSLGSPQLQRLARKFKFHLLAVASLDMIIFKKRMTKVLISLRECAGWSAPFVCKPKGEVLIRGCKHGDA